MHTVISYIFRQAVDPTVPPDEDIIDQDDVDNIGDSVGEVNFRWVPDPLRDLTSDLTSLFLTYGFLAAVVVAVGSMVLWFLMGEKGKKNMRSRFATASSGALLFLAFGIVLTIVLGILNQLL